MKYIKNLSNNIKKREGGGKAQILSSLKRSGFNVPNGFVLTTNAFSHFVNDRREKYKDIKNYQFPPDILKEIGHAWKLLKNKKVIVRSSATIEDSAQLSFAGQYATFMNIQNERRLIEGIKKCYYLMFTKRVSTYCKNNKIDLKAVEMGVVIQEMIDTDFSGVMFTKDPVKNSEDIIIETTKGLGDLLTSGYVNPNRYVINKDDMKIKSKHLEYAQQIPDNILVEIAKLGKRIENLFEISQDIEWGLKNREIYLFQSRPITTLKKLSKKRFVIGIPSSNGQAKGIVNIIKGYKELDKFKRGEILVSDKIDIDFLPLIKKSKAIITGGGLTSHISILAREFEIPCVVGLKYPTKIFKKGEKVLVDGFGGVIHRLDKTK